MLPGVNYILIGLGIVVVLAILYGVYDSQRRKKGSGYWVKKYSNGSGVSRDMNKMTAAGWSMQGQAGDGKGGIIVTWQR